jgi:hypothetical protein
MAMNMSALTFSSPPAYPFTIEESLDCGASYQEITVGVDATMHAVKCLNQYFDKALRAQITSKRDMSPSPSPKF